MIIKSKKNQTKKVPSLSIACDWLTCYTTNYWLVDLLHNKLLIGRLATQQTTDWLTCYTTNYWLVDLFKFFNDFCKKLKKNYVTFYRKNYKDKPNNWRCCYHLQIYVYNLWSWMHKIAYFHQLLLSLYFRTTMYCNLKPTLQISC